jgi:putative endonuclease
MSRLKSEERNKKLGKMKNSHYVYLLICEDGSYYTGYTSDVASRFEKHMKGYGARYTRMRKPKSIVHVEEFRTRAEAMRRERQVKSLSHREKGQLVSIKSEGKHRTVSST